MAPKQHISNIYSMYSTQLFTDTNNIDLVASICPIFREMVEQYLFLVTSLHMQVATIDEAS